MKSTQLDFRSVISLETLKLLALLNFGRTELWLDSLFVSLGLDPGLCEASWSLWTSVRKELRRAASSTGGAGDNTTEGRRGPEEQTSTMEPRPAVLN